MNARLPRTAQPWRMISPRVASGIVGRLHRYARKPGRSIAAPDAPQSPSDRRADLGIPDITALAGQTDDHFDSWGALVRKAQCLADAASERVALDGNAEPARDRDSIPKNIIRCQSEVEPETLPEKTAPSGENAVELRTRPQ